MIHTRLQREWDRLSELFYDGTFPGMLYLDQFNYRVERIKRLDPDVFHGEIFLVMCSQLMNAERPPVLGLDGKRYIGPETWLRRQEENEIYTYEKLRSGLYEQ